MTQLEKLKNALEEHSAVVELLKEEIRKETAKVLQENSRMRQTLKFVIFQAISRRDKLIEKIVVPKNLGTTTELQNTSIQGVLCIADSNPPITDNRGVHKYLNNLLNTSETPQEWNMEDTFHTIVVDVSLGKKLLEIQDLESKLISLSKAFHAGTRGKFNERIKLVILTN